MYNVNTLIACHVHLRCLILYSGWRWVLHSEVPPLASSPPVNIFSDWSLGQGTVGTQWVGVRSIFSSSRLDTRARRTMHDGSPDLGAQCFLGLKKHSNAVGIVWCLSPSHSWMANLRRVVHLSSSSAGLQRCPPSNAADLCFPGAVWCRCAASV